jgi:glycosyltransferase involved in cell wall biosynthesis
VDATSRGDRRVLIITREFPPAIGPHSLRIAKLTKYLPEFGWRATVITAPVDHAWGTDDSLAREVEPVPLERVPRLFTGLLHPRAGLNVEAGGPLPGFDDWRPPIRGRMSRLLVPDSGVLWALPAASRARALAARHDAVLTTAPPFSTHLAGLLVARLTGLPWVAEYRDNWTVNPLYSRGRIANALNRMLERIVVRSARRIAVISEEARMELEAAFPRARGRVGVAPNGFDPDDIPVTGGRPDRFVIVYTGSLHRRRDPSTLLAALAAQGRADAAFAEDVRLALVGNIPAWVEEEAVRAIGADRVSTRGLLPHRRALEVAAGAAALLVISSGAEGGTATMTSKLLEYLGLRRPILMLAPEGPGVRLVRALEAGAVAAPDDQAAIQAAVAELYAQWRSRSERILQTADAMRWTRRETARSMAALLDAAVR